VATAGRFDLIRGRLDILGKRLVLSEASAQLQGDFDPFIRAVATTTEGDATITITVEGPASAPEVRFSSAPELPEDEILARLLFGRDITQLSALQIANAVRVLSGQSGEGVVGRLRQNFGLDDLDITTNEDGTAGLSVGRYINENVYTDVTVDSTGRSEINLNIQLSPSLTARGSASSDGNTGVGLFFERDY
jgi:translocation and assembly module TamB